MGETGEEGEAESTQMNGRELGGGINTDEWERLGRRVTTQMNGRDWGEGDNTDEWEGLGRRVRLIITSAQAYLTHHT